jgi:hypothetical protein
MFMANVHSLAQQEYVEPAFQQTSMTTFDHPKVVKYAPASAITDEPL